MERFPRFNWLVLLAAILHMAAAKLSAEDISPEQRNFFESKIRPVLIKECYGCHSNQAGNVRGGLRLDTQSLMHIGGSSGPAIVPGNLEESLLYNAIQHEDWVMPPQKQLPANVIEDFRVWIEMGAPDPRVTEFEEIKSSISAEDIVEARENFWAYKAPVDHPTPQIQDTSWPKTDIDAFVLSKLEAANVGPAADAEAFKLLRRLCFDLVGLPPTPEQIEYFEAKWAENPDAAVEFVVDSLLEKEQFGERWGRHWLDVARYAESTGREVNMTYPHAWRYRDYVIDSFNADKPFDEFVQEQLAGDLLPVDSDQEWAENLVATTFLAMGSKNLSEQNKTQFEMDLVDEQIDATTRVFMGTSVSCARCHDHKFDPIPQSDYYALAGVFGNMTTYFGNPPSEFGKFRIPQRKQESSLIRLPIDDPNPYDKRYTPQELEDLRSQISGIQDEAASSRRNLAMSMQEENRAAAIRNRLRSANELSELGSKLAVVDENGNPLSYCMGVQEKSAPKDVRLLVRGEIELGSDVVPRGFPQVLCSTPIEIDADESGRLKLARWIGSTENPLTARVMVNRIWQHLLGKGIVNSPDNFGITGSAPSHPELLDHLAIKFVESGWSVKAMVKSIATSRVYRMSTEFNEAYHQLDPENTMLWRTNPRRLDAESIRDAMLSMSGELDLERPRGSEVAKAGYVRVRNGVLGNPRDSIQKVRDSVTQEMRGAFTAERGGSQANGANLRQALRSRNSGRQAYADALANAVRKATNQLDMEDAKFRSVYLPIVRDEEPRVLEVFDFADPSIIVGARDTSNTSNQALFMLNNNFVIQQADAFAARIVKMSSRPDEQIRSAFVFAYGREPTRGERMAATAFVRSYASGANVARGRQTGSPQINAPQVNATETLSALCQSLFASAEFRFLD